MKVAFLVLTGLLALLVVIQQPDVFPGSDGDGEYWLQFSRDAAAVTRIANRDVRPTGDPGLAGVAGENADHLGASDPQMPVTLLLLIGLFAFAFTGISYFRQR